MTELIYENPYFVSHRLNIMNGGVFRIELIDWLYNNAEGEYELYSNCVKFELESDRLIFELRWL